MGLTKLRSALTVISLAIPLACATGHLARGASTVDTNEMQVADTIAMPVMKVDVPPHPDSAWAVATAAKMLAGKDTTQRFELLHLCQVTGAYLVDMTPKIRRRPVKQPILQFGGGGIVFISLYGEAVVVVAYQ